MAGEIVGVPYVDGKWVTLTHPGIPGSRHDVNDIPEALEFFEGKGWVPLKEDEPEPEEPKKSSKATKAATEKKE